jgi:cell division protease FtsH
VTAHAIDEEVRRVVEVNYKRARTVLETNLDKLHTMAEALIKYETIDDTQIKAIMEGRKPEPPEGWEDTSGGGNAPARPATPETASGSSSKPAAQH